MHYDRPDCLALKSPPLIEFNLMVEGNLFRRLIKRLVRAWRNGEPHAALPDPVQATERYIYLGIMSPEVWQDLLWTMSVDVHKKFEKTSAKEARSIVETTSQLMKLWDILSKQSTTASSAKPQHLQDPQHPQHPQHSQSSPMPEPQAAMWSSLPRERPPLPHAKAISLWQFRSRLGYFFRQIPSNKITRISYSALLTFDVLTREGVESRLGEDLMAECRPFIEFLAHLIPGSILMTDAQSSTNGMQFQLEGTTVPAEQIAALFERLKDAPRKARNIIGTSGASFNTDEAEMSPEGSLSDFHYSRIARAYSQRKAPSIYYFWQEACEAFPKREGNPKARDVPPRLYDLTIQALMAFRRSEQAIQVWNAMIENETQPTVKTWTAMLVGCGESKDIATLNLMWAKMLSYGIEPDAHAWSARISAILRAGKTQHGLRVLEEMGKTWTEAYNRRVLALGNPEKKNDRQGVLQASGKKNDRQGVQASGKDKDQQVDETQLPAKPSIVILNGAVTALSHSSTANNQHYLGKVLAWGRSFSIQPDVYTYNALIQMCLRLNNAQEAMRLLRQMETNNVQADAATFAIILNSVFRSPKVSAAPPEEQNRKVMSVLQDLESRGLQATGHIYTTLIDGLLKNHGNEQAARAVLNYMAEKKIELSPHIYTTLMSHYFDNWDFEAIDALWTQIKESGAVMDTVFFDRMIERYGELNNTDKMLSFLDHMSSRGLSPSFPALQAIVIKLADQGDWERFEDIVKDVEQSRGIAKRGMRRSPQNVINQFLRAVQYKRSQRDDILP